MSSQLEAELEAKKQWIQVHYTSKKDRNNPQSFGAYACEWAEDSHFGNKKMYYAKMVGSHSAIKGLLAACSLGHSLHRSAPGGGRLREVASASEKGCRGRSFTEKLPNGSFMGIWVTTDPTFLMGESNEQIFEMIRERYTLPALSEWGDLIIKKMKENYYIDELNGHRCNASLVSANEESIDQLITELIQNGELSF